jgi:hypothetical protein
MKNGEPKIEPARVRVEFSAHDSKLLRKFAKRDGMRANDLARLIVAAALKDRTKQEQLTLFQET